MNAHLFAGLSDRATISRGYIRQYLVARSWVCFYRMRREGRWRGGISTSSKRIGMKRMSKNASLPQAFFYLSSRPPNASLIETRISCSVFLREAMPLISRAATGGAAASHINFAKMCPAQIIAICSAVAGTFFCRARKTHMRTLLLRDRGCLGRFRGRSGFRCSLGFRGDG